MNVMRQLELHCEDGARFIFPKVSHNAMNLPRVKPPCMASKVGTAMCGPPADLVEGNFYNGEYQGDCAMLPLEHSTAEEIAEYFWDRLVEVR